MAGKLTREELDAWRSIPTAVISDEQGHKGILDPNIRCLAGHRFAGQALTIRTIPEPNAAAHWAISQVTAGDVILIDGSAYPDSAIWGGNLICAGVARGLGGLVVDGNVRDGDDLRASGISIYARRIQAVGWNWGGVVNQDIQCGGVPVSPSDLIVGDGDGVAVVKCDGREHLLRRCKERMTADEELQAAVRAGKSAIEYLRLPPFRGERA